MHQFNKSRQLSDPVIPRGKLNLRLTGFSQQNFISIEQVVLAIDRLPSFHLEGLREIAYLTKEQAATILLPFAQPHLNDQKAAFIQRQRKIEIYGFDQYALFQHALYHEIGHYVYFLVISSALKQYWVTQIYPDSHCLTSYEASGPIEGFAETYANYVLTPEKLRLIPAKYAFMHHLVFSGASITLKEKNLKIAK